ncbi:hypothetical protein [Allochromatium palmeri]|uniref:Sulfur globule protein CV1 n=1 Tax=Allochromatium palmeri TaxID=231048 RepID=A0A6N8ECH9_9GAMM|nr:hypothetical protein [Allochromatium palmeri]MTW21271.1 hypothetical protein [Allochromatium palmeri]
MSVSVKPKPTLAILALSGAVAIMAYTPVSHAFNFGNMMNPNRWFGGDRDRYDDPYWGGGPYGYGYPGVYGAPYGPPYGAPGLGVPPAGYGAVPAQAPAPSTQPQIDPGEVEALKRRIEELESRQQGPSQPQPPEWPSAPAFRPMNQY